MYFLSFEAHGYISATIHNNNFIYSSPQRKLNEQSQYELFD